MGLDMYLTARYFIFDDKQRKSVKAPLIPGLKGMKIEKIICEGVYWRKANHIHKWFVDNVQEGKDDCGEYYVSREKLKELLLLVNAVKKTQKNSGRPSAIAKNKLPTASGFFFGGTDYDEDYFRDLEETEKGIKKMLRMPKGWDFYYHASW